MTKLTAGELDRLEHLRNLEAADREYVGAVFWGYAPQLIAEARQAAKWRELVRRLAGDGQSKFDHNDFNAAMAEAREELKR